MKNVLQVKLRRGLRLEVYPFARSYLVPGAELAGLNPFATFGRCLTSPLSAATVRALTTHAENLPAMEDYFGRKYAALHVVVPLNISGKGEIQSILPKEELKSAAYFASSSNTKDLPAYLEKISGTLSPQATRIYYGPGENDSMSFCSHCAYITRRFAGGCSPGVPDCFGPSHVIPPEKLLRRNHAAKPPK